MKHLTLAIAAFCLAPTPLAQADDPRCKIFQQLIEAAPSGFAEFRGDPIPNRPSFYQSTFKPRGFAVCVIGTGGKTTLICYSQQKKADAELLYMSHLVQHAICLKDWQTQPPITDDLPTPPPGQPGLVSESGARFLQQRGDVEITFGISSARIDVPEPAPRVVGFGFVWKTPALGS